LFLVDLSADLMAWSDKTIVVHATSQIRTSGLG
jgi:hypothetical protein